MDFTEKLAKFDCSLGHACQFCPDEATCGLDKPHHNKRLIEARLEQIDQIIVVLANKGGVGKSTVTANLGAGLAKRGFRVGVADADIHGPNQSRFFGFAGARTRTTHYGLRTQEFQAEGIDHAVKVGSLAFMLEDDTTPVVWRDAYKHDFVHHLIGSFNWGSLDYLLVDMPPGTGNELITLCDMLEGANVSAVLVTTPQAVAQMDSLKAGRFCNERGLPVIGAVANMAGVVCPHCQGAFHVFPDAGLDAALDDIGIASIAAIPLAPELAMGSDCGQPIVTGQPDSAVAAAFDPLIEAVCSRGREDFDTAVAHTLGQLFQDNLDDHQLHDALATLPEAVREELSGEIATLLNGEVGRLRDSAPPRQGTK
ncbi:MAG: P-loop NTPase [Hyphomicrobiaceae bacterium]